MGLGLGEKFPVVFRSQCPGHMFFFIRNSLFYFLNHKVFLFNRIIRLLRYYSPIVLFGQLVIGHGHKGPVMLKYFTLISCKLFSTDISYLIGLPG